MRLFPQNQIVAYLVILVLFTGNLIHGQIFQKFNEEHGLPYNEIVKICQDEDGFIYTATSAGLNVFDGNKFKQYNSSNSPGFSNPISDLIPIEQNLILIGTENNGLFILNKEIDKILRLNIETENGSVILPILSLHKDTSGTVWIGTRNKGLYSFYTDSIISKYVNPTVFCDKSSFSNNISISDICSTTDKVWLGTIGSGIYCIDKRIKENNKPYKFELNLPNQNIWCIEIYGDSLYVGTESGLTIFDLNTKKSVHFFQKTSNPNNSSNIVRAITKDMKGAIWVGCQEEGIYRLKPSENGYTIQNYTSDLNSFTGLNTNKILSLYADKYDNIWVGTWNGGLAKYNLNSEHFKNIRNHNKSNILSENMTKCITRKDKDSYWVGTYGNGICIYNSNENSFYEKINLKNNNSVSSLFNDTERNLLLAGSWGFGLKIYETPSLKLKYSSLLNHPKLKNDRIYSIHKDKHGIYWLATITSGLFSLDLQRGKIKHFDIFDFIDNPAGKDAELRQILPGNKPNTLIVLKHDYGIYEVTTNIFGNVLKIKDLLKEANLKEIYEFNFLKCAFLDGENNLYIGTDNGVLIKESGNDSYSTILNNQNVEVQDIIEDEYKNIWIGVYSGGLIKYSPSVKSFNRYFPSSIFFKLHYSTESKKIVAATHSGLYELNPALDVEDPFYPEIYFDNLSILYRSIKPGDSITSKQFLNRHINYLKHLTIPYSHNTFSLDINTISFSSSKDNNILYRVKGIDKMWHERKEASTRITYRKIQPGDYTLQVKTSNKDNVWNPSLREINFTILPPWWKTSIAYFVYILLIILTSLFTIIKINQRNVTIQKRNIKKITQEKEEALNEQKLQFFTNISHDIRTPLTLIIGSLDNIISKERTGTWLNKKHQVMYRNAMLLLRLVTQVLDFRKFEKKKLELNYSKIDISKFVRYIFSQFESAASQKNINLYIKETVESKSIYADREKLEKVLLNLVSNALNHTFEGCFIEIAISLKEKDVVIQVKDNGEGIDEKDLPYIFNRFYQSTNSNTTGTGIGLALVQKIVETHKGKISVESQKGKGAIFIIELPFGNPLLEAESEAESTEQNSVSEPELLELNGHKNNIKQSSIDEILVVDDNEDIREYLKENLSDQYKIITAKNGNEGIEKAKSKLPSLIICDIMMEGIDGIEVCEIIKSDIITSHIPVILLTSKTSEESTIIAYQKGADDYITKPFSIKLVKTRVQNLIKERNNLRKKFSLLDFSLNATPRNLDEKFIIKIVKFIEDNLSNADLSVLDIASSIKMSHDQYYRKIKNITGLSANKFTRKVRLNKAVAYIQEQHYNISEILYKVGFSSPSYFTKSFKEEFGCTPSEMMNDQME